MKKILLSSSLILFVATSVALGTTGAFFSDTETSSGNTFTAGAIDLKIDNSSYYNGLASPSTSWVSKDLTSIEKFFNFLDLKPSDYGEDTISLHVDTNDAYLCADVTLTSNDDNDPTEPELLDDQSTGVGQGELANNVNFIWWADDGDNVLETDEEVISSGPIGALTLGEPYKFALADSATNIWSNQPGPVKAGETLYIGKAWCFGNISAAPLSQDDFGDQRTPAGDNNGNQASGEPEDGGYACDGSLLNNSTQTDSLTADISFSAVQSRHNDDFLCVSGGCQFDENANLITNGSFEDPLVFSAEKWDIFGSPISGWHAEWRSGMATTFNNVNRPTPKIELHNGVLGFASEGNQYAELDSDWNGHTGTLNGEPASIMVYQDVPTTVGAGYKLKFAFAPRPSTSASENSLKVMWGGSLATDIAPVAGVAGPIGWTVYEFNVVATTTTTQLSFTDEGTANSEGTFLDDVVLTQTSCAQ